MIDLCDARIGRLLDVAGETIVIMTRRKQAIRLGLDRYFTGKPCANGHVAERYTRNATCTCCSGFYYDRDKASLEKAARTAGERAERAPDSHEPCDWS